MWTIPWTIPLVLQSAAVALTAALVVGYAYATYHYDKWKKLGVPHTEPTPVFGHVGDTLLGRRPLHELVQPLYRRFDGHRYFGVYEAREPVLVVRDPALVHAVMVEDFASFYDRNAGKVSFDHDTLFNHVFNMRGDRWKAIRNKLSPIFTASKLKHMLADMHMCTERLMDNLKRQTAARDGIVNVSEAAAQFTTDVIGCCAFGLDLNSLSNPDSEYRQAGRDLIAPSRKYTILNFIRMVGLGRLLNLFRIRRMPDNVYFFFDKLLNAAWEHHETGENTRNDFIALLMKLKDEEKHMEPEQRLFQEDILASNAFVFFVAGFETTASTISYCLYELAKNQEIQNKLREKLDKTLDKSEAKHFYDTLKDMQYLDMVINETLRMHPPLPVLNRACTKRYTVPDSDLTLNVGEKVIVPAYSLHYDPAYYPDPEVFDPERFTEKNCASRPRGTFVPFGDGPRICIGKRFALMETKTGLAEILRNYKVTPCEYTQTPIKVNPVSLFLSPIEPIRLKFEKIN